MKKMQKTLQGRHLCVRVTGEEDFQCSFPARLLEITFDTCTLLLHVRQLVGKDKLSQ